jgi:hypothetical protein
MKFYMASDSGSDSDGMNYKNHGREKDLYQLFPEWRQVINRYPFKTIDFRLANGDRLRIYDIQRPIVWMHENFKGKCNPEIRKEFTHEKRTLINP